MFTIERNGFVKVSELMLAVVKDMTANGFSLKFPATLPADGLSAPLAQVYTLEPDATVDPLVATQPWRIAFKVLSAQAVIGSVATPIQLPDSGLMATWPRGFSLSDTLPDELIGCIGSERAIPVSATGAFERRGVRLFDRTSGTRAIASDLDSLAAPMSYRLSITDRGVALFIWEPGTESYIAGETGTGGATGTNLGGNYNSWLVVQRPVDKDTGATVVAGKAPVVCVFKLFDEAYQFVVRESDIPVPVIARSATRDTEDSRGLINFGQQVAINEGDVYVSTFPARFNTRRYAYPHEIDMIAITSADVIGDGVDVPLRVYGEADDRVYKSMQANMPYNTGMRVLLLTEE